MAAMVAMVAMKPMAVPCQGQEELEVEQQELRECHVVVSLIFFRGVCVCV